MTLVLLAVVVFTASFPRLRWRLRSCLRPRSEAPKAQQELELVELTALGVAAGMAFESALAEAAELAGGSLGEQVTRALRTGASSHRQVAVLTSAAAHARISGTPVLGALDALSDTMRAEYRADRLAAVRRLPVKLLFPLALLILPGFLLLTLGPVVARSARLLGL